MIPYYVQAVITSITLGLSTFLILSFWNRSSPSVYRFMWAISVFVISTFIIFNLNAGEIYSITDLSPDEITSIDYNRLYTTEHIDIIYIKKNEKYKLSLFLVKPKPFVKDFFYADIYTVDGEHIWKLSSYEYKSYEKLQKLIKVFGIEDSFYHRDILDK